MSNYSWCLASSTISSTPSDHPSSSARLNRTFLPITTSLLLRDGPPRRLWSSSCTSSRVIVLPLQGYEGGQDCASYYGPMHSSARKKS